MKEQKYENNTLPEILAELRQVNLQRNGERVYDLYVPPKDPAGPCKVLPQSLGDIADRIEKAAKEAETKTDPEAARKALEHVRAWLRGMLACIPRWPQEIVYVPADSAFYILDEINKALGEDGKI